jgi:ribonuclease HI
MSYDSPPGDASPTALAAERPVVIQHRADELDSDLVEVVAAEQLLLTTTTTGDIEQVDRLLHPDFLEFGASGRTWGRQDVIRVLSAKPGAAGHAGDFSPLRLGSDSVLLTYRIDGAGGRLCSSVWLRDGDSGWRLRFHQATHSPA